MLNQIRPVGAWEIIKNLDKIEANALLDSNDHNIWLSSENHSPHVVLL